MAGPLPFEGSIWSLGPSRPWQSYPVAQACVKALVISGSLIWSLFPWYLPPLTYGHSSSKLKSSIYIFWLPEKCVMVQSGTCLDWFVGSGEKTG